MFCRNLWLSVNVIGDRFACSLSMDGRYSNYFIKATASVSLMNSNYVALMFVNERVGVAA